MGHAVIIENRDWVHDDFNDHPWFVLFTFDHRLSDRHRDWCEKNAVGTYVMGKYYVRFAQEGDALLCLLYWGKK